MASPFDDLDDAASAAILDTFGGGEAIITPMVRADYVARAADPDREPIRVPGVFSEGTNSERLSGQSTGAEFTGPTRIIGPHPTFWIAAADAARMTFRPRSGDHLKYGSRDFSVVRPASSDRGDLTIQLSEDVAP